jgi:hypothetical protein
LKHFYKYLLLTLAITFACDGDEGNRTEDKGENYFPMQVGFFQRYLVDEIRYSAVAEPETLAYELLHEVVDSFLSTEGNKVYVIQRSTRDNGNSPWQFQETWSARINSNEAVIIEGNIAYTNLLFSPSPRTVWDGNRYNNLGNDDYKIIAVDQPISVSGISFDKTLTVEQELNDDPIVFTDIRFEVYARDVGLILKETTQLRYCQQQTCGGDELIESGVIYKQRIVEYGVQ